MVKKCLVVSGLAIFLIINAARLDAQAENEKSDTCVTNTESVYREKQTKMLNEAHEYIESRYLEPIKPVPVSEDNNCTENEDKPLDEPQVLDDTQALEEDETFNLSNEDNDVEYLGTWTITAYCGCSQCCGECDMKTASERTPVANHTIACNILPFYTQVMIDGVIYEVEDTGYTEFGNYWIDIYFDSHEEALNYGVQEHEVYLIH